MFFFQVRSADTRHCGLTNASTPEKRILSAISAVWLLPRQLIWRTILGSTRGRSLTGAMCVACNSPNRLTWKITRGSIPGRDLMCVRCATNRLLGILLYGITAGFILEKSRTGKKFICVRYDYKIIIFGFIPDVIFVDLVLIKQHTWRITQKCIQVKNRLNAIFVLRAFQTGEFWKYFCNRDKVKIPF